MNEKRDCNQCGDYEHCAFDYKNCTGFIPGSNYTYEKVYELQNKLLRMEEITVLEYLQYEDNFFKMHGEYMEKKEEIDLKEKAGELSEKDAQKQRQQLEKEYNPFIHVEMSNKYCFISDALEIAYKATGKEISRNFKHFLSEHKKYKGKHVTMAAGLSGELLGVAVAIDDFYYVIKDDKTGKTIFDTGVDGIEKVD